jgi:putative addiction module component (TIGR02574 family)
MSPDAERLLTEAMALPDDERAALAVILEDSVGRGSSIEGLEAAWAAEIQDRLTAVRSGEVELIPTEEVERELEELLSLTGESHRATG